MSDAHSLEHHHHQMQADSTDVFGFWLYIMTDCILFGSLFATFIVLHYPGAYGPSLKPHIELPYVLIETFFLLCGVYLPLVRTNEFWFFSSGCIS